MIPYHSASAGPRFAASAADEGNRHLATDRFPEWLAERNAANRFRVSRAPLDRLNGWDLDDATGKLTHHTGRFYSIQGLEVITDHRPIERWTQPIIVQPEVGILGILVKEFDGVLHFLMQAKMEPGNVPTLQLSPTIQATRSNYTGAHKGSATPYLDYFLSPRKGQVHADSLQSEQGSWFLHKRNRNIVVEVSDDVEVRDDFCWLTLGQIYRLLRTENVINMDTRTVLAGLPLALGEPVAGDDRFTAALRRSGSGGAALHSEVELLSWFTELKTHHTLQQRLIPLNEAEGWHLTSGALAHDSDAFFTVVGVDVEVTSREVTRWSQPLLAPRGQGVAAFLTREFGGVLHLLVQARSEAGTIDVVEMAPTVQANPENPAGAPARFLDEVLAAPADRVHYDVVLSEEGGRFLGADNRYLVVEAAEDFPAEVPDDFVWMTVEQATRLGRFGGHFNVEARTLLAALHALSFGAGR